ncbi:PDIL1-2 [Symbiodinium natans]|uniref:PDIL1-2 protein n=1 Tax=Symbiodinium natans TaxID=878477 RepID=A0A812TNI2_9DINO|nr:PDIL1-2 [Symbiodinium natans]
MCLFTALALFAVAANAAVEEGKWGWIDVDTGNIDEVLKQGPIFVKFFAPWCSHCKNMAKDFHRVAQEELPDGIRVGRVDSTKNPALNKRFGISGYPTLLMLSDEGRDMRSYSGDRSFNSLLEFAQGGWKTAPVHDPAKPRPKQSFGDQLKSLPWTVKAVGLLFIVGLPLSIFAACYDVYTEKQRRDARRAERKAEAGKTVAADNVSDMPSHARQGIGGGFRERELLGDWKFWRCERDSGDGSPFTVLSMELVAEFFQFHGLHHSLSVFQCEAQLTTSCAEAPTSLRRRSELVAEMELEHLESENCSVLEQLVEARRVDVPHRSVSEQQPEEKEEVKIQVQSPTHKELAPPKKPKSDTWPTSSTTTCHNAEGERRGLHRRLSDPLGVEALQSLSQQKSPGMANFPGSLTSPVGIAAWGPGRGRDIGMLTTSPLGHRQRLPPLSRSGLSIPCSAGDS